jgi:hypothetical protein
MSILQVKLAMQTKLQLFDMPHSYAMKFKGEKQMAMKTTGHERLHVTVMQCITASGNKLPPYIILNRKTVPKENFCKDVIVQAKEMHG